MTRVTTEISKHVHKHMNKPDGDARIKGHKTNGRKEDKKQEPDYIYNKHRCQRRKHTYRNTTIHIESKNGHRNHEEREWGARKDMCKHVQTTKYRKKQQKTAQSGLTTEGMQNKQK